MGTFSAQVKDAANSSKERLRKIAATAIQDQLSRMQTPVAQGGNMPVDTSFLRNSLVSELNGVPKAEGGYVAAIAEIQIGDTMRFSWTAEYAMRLHYGFNGDDSIGRTYAQDGNMWIDKSVQYWQADVDAAANRFKE